MTPNSKIVKIWLPIALLAVIGVAKFATVFMTLATIAYFSLVTGLLLRKSRIIHARLMRFGILLDISIVLLLQIQRHAVQTALKFSLSPLQQAHIGASLVATLLYFPILYLGWTLLKNPRRSKELRPLHIRLGVTAFIFRSAGFLLMFSLLMAKKISEN